MYFLLVGVGWINIVWIARHFENANVKLVKGI